MSETKLTIVQGPMKGREFTFAEHDTFLFGRDPSCHVNLPNDNFISRYHFLLEINPPCARLRDLGSLNGTLVNDLLVGGKEAAGRQRREDGEPQEVELKDGDRIQAGQTVFLLQLLTDPPTEVRDAVTVEMDANAHSPFNTAALEPRDGAWRDQYEIVRELGRGGMGIVYLAARRSNGVQVALKVVRPQNALRDIHTRILARETAVLAQLNDRHIVHLLAGHNDGINIVLAMEYCNKGSVEDLMKKRGGALPLSLALPIMKHVLKGLAYAHAREFVHRDIKPANILLSEREGSWVARIGDFGLAKSFDKAGLSNMTNTGSFAGTLDYVPSEQVTNYKYTRPVSDVWSAAATFYRMLSGHLPREKDARTDAIECVLRNEITFLGRRETNLPRELVRVIDKALSPDPANRFPTAVEFLAAVENLHMRGS